MILIDFHSFDLKLTIKPSALVKQLSIRKKLISQLTRALFGSSDDVQHKCDDLHSSHVDLSQQKISTKQLTFMDKNGVGALEKKAVCVCSESGLLRKKSIARDEILKVLFGHPNGDRIEGIQ
jgi:hypothetical protein